MTKAHATPDALVSVRDLAVRYRRRKFGDEQIVRAVDGVDLEIRRGETLALVGESGCGKSSLARALLHLLEPAEGTVRFEGAELASLSDTALRSLRTKMQIVFQDPYASLNPFMRVKRILREPLDVHRIGSAESREDAVQLALERVGLDKAHGDRYPHQLSGGQRQRVAVGRALILEPAFVVLDEPVSALDVSIQAQVLKLLGSVQADLQLTYLFVTHDLAVVRKFADRVAVMYLGKIAEMGNINDVFQNPSHPYTVALLSAVPRTDPLVERTRARIVLSGDIPSPVNPPPGCRFRSRCWLYQQLGSPEVCEHLEPSLETRSETHNTACHFPDELGRGKQRI